MKAARIYSWGNADVIKIEEVEVPQVKDSEVLIEVHAAGVNPIDWKIREGYFADGMKDCFPFPLGWDVSGKVVALPKNVTQFRLGDEVFGLIRFPQAAGTFAEFVTAPVTDICLKPFAYDHVHAAAVPLVALTAWQALHELANLKSGQQILIHAAAGGVGQFAVQFAKIMGAKVIVTGSLPTKDLLHSLGADQFIDYKTEKFEDKVKELDVVFDSVGGETTLRSLAVVKRGGKLITIPRSAQGTIIEKAKEKNVDTPSMLVRPEGSQLKLITQLINDGLIKTTVQATYPLEQVKAACDLVQTGHCHGKVVIKIK